MCLLVATKIFYNYLELFYLYIKIVLQFDVQKSICGVIKINHNSLKFFSIYNDTRIPCYRF